MAGVLPYTKTNPFTGADNEGLWVLVGKEKGGKDKKTWDMFSGKADESDGSLKVSAAREAAEESCELLGKMDSIQKDMFSLNGSKSTFLLEISNPKLITPEIFKARKTEHKYSKSCFQEKSRVKWVKLGDLIDACANKKGVLSTAHEEMQIRPYFAKIINKNRDFLANKINNISIQNIKENNFLKKNVDISEKSKKISTVITSNNSDVKGINQNVLPLLKTKVYKTPIEKLKTARINPFKIDFIQNGKKRTAETQAKEILDYMSDFFKKNMNAKIAITYSANSEQAEDIYAGYKSGKFSIEGANQAKLFSSITKEIQQRSWQDKVHILPVPTCEKSGGKVVSKQEDVEKAMKNIARHLGGGWYVLGLQNQNCNSESPFAIGGGVADVVWGNSSQKKYVHDHMIAMLNGKISKDLQSAYQNGLK
ncbi:MAG: hypothetical protein H0V82_01700 [Candidatus Protochlamydia sp.]|nr:hypothetical protein [Candidatus Protochlamydia sp.]